MIRFEFPAVCRHFTAGEWPEGVPAPRECFFAADGDAYFLILSSPDLLLLVPFQFDDVLRGALGWLGSIMRGFRDWARLHGLTRAEAVTAQWKFLGKIQTHAVASDIKAQLEQMRAEAERFAGEIK